MSSSASDGDGILLTSKPPGVTSHDVVERVRRTALGAGRKVGHAGTLDPFATGLLLLLVGRATRVQRFFVGLPKTYRACARFGARSDTGDPTGVITDSGGHVRQAELETALPRLTGEVRQRVPMTSAVKVGGERLYRKARRGEQVSTPERTIVVTRLDLLAFDEDEQAATFLIECSSGTYVRQLVSDLGDLLGSGAYCSELERLAIGSFRVEEASDELIPLFDALDFLPERALDAEEARGARHGRAVEPGGQAFAEGAAVRLTVDGELLAIAEQRDRWLKPVTVLLT